MGLIGLSKGMLIWVDTCWYVVVDIKYLHGEMRFCCICDNANNVYVWEPPCISEFLTLNELKDVYRGPYPDRVKSHEDHNWIFSRPIPWDVIGQVLLGIHDDRF